MIHKQKKNTPNFMFMAFFIMLWGMITGTHNASAFFQDETQQEVEFNLYKGEVLDSKTKKPLVFASLAIEESNISTITNAEGEFSIKIPKDASNANVIVSFLGYSTKTISLTQLNKEKNKIMMDISITELPGVNIEVPKNAEALVRDVLKRKGENYFDDPTLMTAFYRETIKKRRKNVSLSEAVVNIYKTPYTSLKKDGVKLYKARKSTDYDKLDTVALKLQGGPFNALFVDIMKYPEYIFSPETMDHYIFKFDHSTRVNDKLIYVVSFEQNSQVLDPLYKGKLYIDAKNKILTSAIYSLNITDKDLAARLFVRRKPRNAQVWPTDVAYRVDYREKNGKWYYSYSNVLLEFKVNWDKRLFNSVYSMTCEMAVTDWKKNLSTEFPKAKDRIKTSIILSDEAIGFADPDFWGQYNIIEPEKSIESAIKKIQRQLRKANSDGGTSIP
ncbi:carboxypeptidase-like regulatory domain-containing protein [Zobellia laminariae]|uniref:carboxypeptidase-like regulatory domain-containing protein n=1 Tax=Zobellia laminariae TaxID=248906 RepID=UPI0012D941EF|nr:carboxypeptidase-like regulatory domain-containing protein [Zobellia laminariae]